MKSIVSAILGSVFILLIFAGGCLSVYALDRRPKDFPAIHEHLLFLHFDWTAPPSLQAASYDKGFTDGNNAKSKACNVDLGVYKNAIDSMNEQKLMIEKKLLTAHNDAIIARKKELYVLSGIDKMHTTGNSCQRAEQIIRGVIGQ